MSNHEPDPPRCPACDVPLSESPRIQPHVNSSQRLLPNYICPKCGLGVHRGAADGMHWYLSGHDGRIQMDEHPDSIAAQGRTRGDR